MCIWKIRVHADFHDVESYFQHLLSQTLTKMYDGVLALTKFSELKLDDRFGCILDRQACMPTFTMFRDILTPFKSNPVETA